MHLFTLNIFKSDSRRGSLIRTVLVEGMTRWWPEARLPASSSTTGSSANQDRRLCTFPQARQWVKTFNNRQNFWVDLIQPKYQSWTSCAICARCNFLLLLLTHFLPVHLGSWMSLSQPSGTRETAFPSSSWQAKTTAQETPGTGWPKDRTCW